MVTRVADSVSPSITEQRDEKKEGKKGSQGGLARRRGEAKEKQRRGMPAPGRPVGFKWISGQKSGRRRGSN